MTNTESEPSVDSYCIFQIADTVFAISAVQLREVALRPSLENIPNAPAVLAGLWHAGSEFLPVLRLPSRRSPSDQEPHMLVAKGPQGAWGLLVERVLAIEPLECAQGDLGNNGEGWSAAVIGTSTWREQLVHVLNVEGVYRLAEQILQSNEAITA